jgi:hypothetical protein
MIYVSLVDSSMFFRSQNPLALPRGNTRSTQPTRWWQHPLMFCRCKGHRIPWTGTLNPCWADLKWSKSKVCFVPPVQISKNDEPSSGFRNYLGQFRIVSHLRESPKNSSWIQNDTPKFPGTPSWKSGASLATIKYQQISATMHRICPVKKPSRPSASNFKYLLMFLRVG